MTTFLWGLYKFKHPELSYLETKDDYYQHYLKHGNDDKWPHDLQSSIDLVNSDFRFQTKKNPNVVVYLIQNKPFTKRNKCGLPREKVNNRLDLFFRSLKLLLKNYPANETFDVHVFHEGDVPPPIQTKIKAMKTDSISIFISHIVFKLPFWLNKDNIMQRIENAPKKKAWRDLGYRHMCRFYSLLIYPKLIEWGYQKMVRLDDDGFLLSPIKELFNKIQKPNSYFCRLFQMEDITYSKHYSDHLKCFCAYHSIPFPDNIFHVPFNNFFVLDLHIYKHPLVQKFLMYVDMTGGIYEHRWGDALIQGTLLKLIGTKAEKMVFDYSKWGVIYPSTDSTEYYSSSCLSQQSFIFITIIILVLLFIVIFLIWRNKNTAI